MKLPLLLCVKKGWDKLVQSGQTEPVGVYGYSAGDVCPK